MSKLTRKSAQSQGVDGRGVTAFLDAVAQAGIELHSFMLLKGGSVVAEAWWEPYDRDTPHVLYSLSKSFTSVAAGIAEHEGLLQMDDRLSAHLEEAHDYGEATIADALRMSVGHLLDPVLDPSVTDLDMDAEGDAALRALLREYSPERPPGEIFTYDQLATFAVAKIIEQRSGGSLFDYLRPRLFEPLGITDAKWFGGASNPGFAGLYLTTESIAAFGQLLLQRGRWQGKQLIPEKWLATATSLQMPNDAAYRFPPGQPVEPESANGYGYQFWMSTQGYNAGGAYTQLCLVLPELDAVVAITASTALGQVLFDALWEHLAPALAAAEGVEDPGLTRPRSVPAPVAGAPAFHALQAKANLGMAAVMVTTLHGEKASDTWRAAAARAEEWVGAAAAFTGTAPLEKRDVTDIDLTFHRAEQDDSLPEVRFGALGGVDLPELTQVRLIGDSLELTLDGSVSVLPIGFDHWIRGDIQGDVPIPFATRGGWAPSGLFEAELRMIESPHVGSLALDTETGLFTFTWREPTLMGRGLQGYRV